MEVEKQGRFEGFYPPYLRLRESAEDSFIRRQCVRLPERQRNKLFARPAEVTLNDDKSSSPWNDLDAYRLFHSQRFFVSLKGFFTGDLDLTGRHEQRFQELISLFVQLVDDMAAAGKTAKPVKCKRRDWDGEMKIFLDYKMTDRELWTNFRLEWKIPRLVDYGWLQRQIVFVKEAMEKAEGKPKFQKLCIIDLPPEIILQIFHLADLKKARLLAATCKAMKALGVSYLYHTRSVTLPLAAHEQIMKMIRMEPPTEVLDKIASQKSQTMIRHVGFLLSRPDLTDAIRHLQIVDHWRMHSREIPALCSYTNQHKYYGPINSSLNTLLASCVDLTTLSISHFAITGDWLWAMSQLSKLHTLDFHCARIGDQSVEQLILSGRIPPSPQLLNLTWKEYRTKDDVEHPPREHLGEGLWYTLLLFPNLVTFSHELIRDDGTIWLPSPTIRDRSNHFCQGLRRLNLDLIWDSVPQLTGWINTSQLRTIATCTLTHFKLRTDRPIPDDMILNLLASFHGAPLEVLSLVGIKEGSLTLIDRIAQLFPDLVGLTLIRRENRLQKEIKLASWPHQSGEYAARFREFRKLKYFGWNFRVPKDDVTPFALLGFEAAEGKEWPRIGGDVMEWAGSLGGDDEYFEDTSSLALPFACHCPTLEIMGLEDGRTPEYWTISHKPNGGIDVEEHVYSRRVVDPRDWNPRPYDSGWKPLTPPA
ncbi:hypothetical protein V5O48_009464 [Marasmius crinis-equi]|uniref:F-box domain-containing protein n=1 Tax=Marasmius crinis-equi TaxID=585013 RepID=A0ABR3FB85_9AGAR